MSGNKGLAFFMACMLASALLVVSASAHEDHEKEQEMVCFELPPPDCGCGIAKLQPEEPETVCLPVVKEKDEDK